MEAKLKHLEFIQGVINRLGTDSFRMKGWAVVLVSALLILLAREECVEFAYVGFFPVLIFWGLDGYFLRQERLYRDLYDHVRGLDKADIDLSMDYAGIQTNLARCNVFHNADFFLHCVGPSGGRRDDHRLAVREFTSY